jgi:hypothetical protein
MRIALLAFVSLVGCAPVFSGSALIDGAPFRPTECHSGVVYGFSGIELGDDHQRVRLVNDPLTGDTRVALFVGPAHGIDLGACAALRQAWEGNVVNGVRVQEGVARLACRSAGHSIEGKVTFEGCR